MNYVPKYEDSAGFRFNVDLINWSINSSDSEKLISFTFSIVNQLHHDV